MGNWWTKLIAALSDAWLFFSREYQRKKDEENGARKQREEDREALEDEMGKRRTKFGGIRDRIERKRMRRKEAERSRQPVPDDGAD